MSWRLGVVGSPVAHSLSPRLHEAALASLDLAGTSEALEIDLESLSRLPELLEHHQALSVTMPLKEAVLDLCTPDDVARRTRAVNSLLVRDGEVFGRSTDGAGFLDALAEDCALDLTDRVVVVRGAGGSARCIVDAVCGSGAREVAVISRQSAPAEELASRYREVVARPTTVADVALVVNTIPFSESAVVDLPEIELEFAEGAVALDVLYHPEETPWLATQRLRGLRTANGLSMLVHQAHHQLEWWFDRPVPLEPLWAAVGR